MRARAWHEVKGRLRSLVVLVLIAGIGGGAVVAAAIGARRTATAYPRLVAMAHTTDALVGIGCPPPAVHPCAPLAGAFYRQVRRLPQFADGVNAPGMEVFSVGPGGHIDYGTRFIAPDDPRFLRTIFREKFFAGRPPNPDDPTEVFVNRPLAIARHYHVGQILTSFRVFPGENRPFSASEGTPVTLRVAGIAIGPNEILTDADTPSGLQMFGTPAFYHLHVSSTAFYFMQVLLRHGAADLGGFQTAMGQVFSQYQGLPAAFSNNHAGTPRIQAAIRPQTLALTLFAIVAGVAVLLVVGLGLARQTSTDAADYPVLHALGMTRRQLVGLALLRGVVVGTGGAVVAVAVAVAASGLMPFGYARIAEPNPGVSANVAWLVVGAAALVVAVLAAAAPSAWFATRDLGRDQAQFRSGRPSWVAARLARMGGSGPLVVGTQLALEAGRGRTAVPARTAIVSAAASITVVGLVLTFSAGLNRLVDSPNRYGQNWDAAIDNVFYPIPLSAVTGAVREAGVIDYAAGNYGDVLVGGRDILAMGLDAPAQHKNPRSFLTVLDGRIASHPGEIALGTTSMRQLHVHVGQFVKVAIGPNVERMQIVGSVVFPAAPVGTTLRPELGDGAQLTAAPMAGPAPPGSPPGSIYTVFPVRFGPGNRADQLSRLRAGVDPMQACPLAPCVITRAQPANVRSYGNVRAVEAVLVALVAVLGLAAIAYAVGTSIRRRRRDFAVLQAIGFLSRQLFQAVTWQALTITVVALGIGVPLGVALGRIGWSAFAGGLGVGTDAVVPVGAIGLGLVASLVTAALLAISFAWPLRRTAPADTLRAE